MNQFKVEVQDFSYVKTNTINNISIRVSSIELFKNISLIVSLFENTTLIDNKSIIITGTEYDNWGSSDTYIIDLVLDKLGLSKKVNVTIS